MSDFLHFQKNTSHIRPHIPIYESLGFLIFCSCWFSNARCEEPGNSTSDKMPVAA